MDGTVAVDKAGEEDDIRSITCSWAIVLLCQYATLEMRGELEPRCVPQLFLGLLLGTRRSAIDQSQQSQKSLRS